MGEDITEPKGQEKEPLVPTTEEYSRADPYPAIDFWNSWYSIFPYNRENIIGSEFLI